MKRTSLASQPCSIARTLDVVGEWWTLLIVRDIAYGITRFREIQDDLGISANVLAERLGTLVAEGILERMSYQERPLREEYRLSEKGVELVPVLIALMGWGDRWASGRHGGPVAVTHGECGHRARTEIRCECCDREVAPEELRASLRGPLEAGPADGEPGAVSARRMAAEPGGGEAAGLDGWFHGHPAT